MAPMLERKVRGYVDDQAITTHSIRGKVANTEVAKSIFDGITYCKGASTLKQLLYLMTPEKFFAGLRTYFKKFEWRNGTIDDFLS